MMTDSFNSNLSFTPLVSVIIPVYNGEEDIPILLEGLRSQTYPKNLVEYLIVDNKSSDATLQLLKQAVQDFAKENLKLTLLQENNIQSSYAARNLGIRHSSGEILLFTDADCCPLPNWIAEFVQPFQDAKIGVVVGELEALPGNSLLERYAERCGMMSQRFLLEHPFCPYGQTANLAIRRAVFQKTGLFRPYLTTGGDADICWRIQKETSWQLTTAPKAIIRHRHRSTLKEFKSQWQRYGRSNRYLHELYGIDLMEDCTNEQIIRRLGQWLIKDLPKKTVKVVLKQAKPIDLIQLPFDLIRFRARSQGQKEAKLLNEAREIEWLSMDH